MKFKSYGNSNRKYCSHGCYIKSRFGTERRIFDDARAV
jgi:hypothetical protein